MDKSLKLLLSLIMLWGCSEATLTQNQKIELAEKKWQVIINQTSHDVIQTQGSPQIMNLLEEIIELNPNHCDALRERSIAYLKRGIPHQWKEYMDQAVACDSTRWIGWRGHHYLYFYRDYKKAIADFDATDHLTPDFIDAPQGHSVDYWRGHAYLGLKDYKNSIIYYQKHIEKVSNDFGEDWVEPDAFLNLGIAFFESRQYSLAEEQLTKALEYYSGKSAETKYYWALYENQRGNQDKALKWINEAMDDFLTGNYKKRPYNEEIGQIYWDQLEGLKLKLSNKKPLSERG